METIAKTTEKTQEVKVNSSNFKINNWTLGSDCEVFIFDKGKNEVINAKKYVKGTKDEPYNFDKSNPFWATSLDNISAEFNIPPCITAKDFSENIDKCIKYINSTLPENLCTVHTPAVYVSGRHLRTREAKILGCEASFNAYTLGMNPRPDGETTNLRTCCTHVHMRYDNMRFQEAAEWVKAMDLFLGIPSLIIEPDNDRRRLYGTIGEMRFGATVEYRTLSSFFSETDELRKWVFNNTVNAIGWINEGHRVSEDLAIELHRAMHENDKDLVRVLIEENNIPMPTK